MQYKHKNVKKLGAPLKVKCVIFETQLHNWLFRHDFYYFYKAVIRMIQLKFASVFNIVSAIKSHIWSPFETFKSKSSYLLQMYWFVILRVELPCSRKPLMFVCTCFSPLSSRCRFITSALWLRIVACSSECECSILYVPILHVNKTVCVLETLRLEQNATFLNYQTDPIYVLLDF